MPHARSVSPTCAPLLGTPRFRRTQRRARRLPHLCSRVPLARTGWTVKAVKRRAWRECGCAPEEKRPDLPTASCVSLLPPPSMATALPLPAPPPARPWMALYGTRVGAHPVEGEDGDAAQPLPPLAPVQAGLLDADLLALVFSHLPGLAGRRRHHGRPLAGRPVQGPGPRGPAPPARRVVARGLPGCAQVEDRRDLCGPQHLHPHRHRRVAHQEPGPPGHILPVLAVLRPSRVWWRSWSRGGGRWWW